MMKKVTIHQLGRVQYQEVPGKFKYRLTQAYYTQLPSAFVSKKLKTKYCVITVDGRLAIPANYRWDGATWAWDCDESMEASLVHDVLCQLYRDGHLDNWYIKPMNDLFCRMCAKMGMPKFRVWYYRQTLRLYWRISRRKDG